MIQLALPYFFTACAALAIASLWGDARRFIAACRDLSRYIQED